MAINGIGAWQYQNVYNLTNDRKRAESVESEKTQEAAPANDLAEIGRKYGVNVTVGSDKSFDGYMWGAGSGNNIYIAKEVADRAKKDPELMKTLEDQISKVPQSVQEIKDGMKRLGSETIACGVQIDKNGRISYWCIGRKVSGNEDNKPTYKEQVQKQLAEMREKKKAEEKASAKNLVAKQTEENLSEKTNVRNGVLKSLQNKYSDIPLSLGQFTPNQASGARNGFQGVLISPIYLAKAEQSETEYAKLDEMLSGVSDAQKWLEGAFANDGLELVANGFYIDDKGNMGSWSAVRKKNDLLSEINIEMNKGAERINKQKAEKQEDKKSEEKAKAKTLEKKRAEEKLSELRATKADSINKLLEKTASGEGTVYNSSFGNMFSGKA